MKYRELIELYKTGKAEAIIRIALLDEPLGVLTVERFLIRLPIRSVLAADVRSLLPVDSEPTQPVDNLSFRAFDVTLLIGILDPQDKSTARFFR